MNPELKILDSIPMTEEAYFQLEADSGIRHEYIDGQVYAMVGSALNHNRIAMNVAREFGNHLKDTPCETFSADIKVRVGSDYVYPDVVVDCHATDNMLVSPVIIVEVLSKSTRKKDTTQKLIRYINLPSLQEYVLIEQDIVSVQVLRRTNAWQPDYYYLGDSVTFDAIGVTLTVDSIYERVDNSELNEFRQLQQGVVVKSSE
jgi:Uma2 family endonuclease